jgi:hypothetical protein
MEVENRFSSELITHYRNYFLEIAYNSYLVPGAQISFRAAEFRMGIIVELYLHINREQPKFEIPDYPVSCICGISSILDAFKALSININEFLPRERYKNLMTAIEQNRRYFSGTVKLYDEDNARIYFIKEKRKELWTKEAAKQDIERLMEDITSLPS